MTSGYVYQMIYDCEYGDDITDVVFFVKNLFNQKIITLYDSRVGKYVGFGESGMKNADHYNHQGWKMEERKRQVETLCRYNARLFRRSTLDRLVPPVIKVHPAKPIDYGKRSMLECSVVGFFPQEVRLTPRRGERVSCRVDHSSQRKSLEVDWDTSSLDAKHLKKTLGIMFFFIGFTAAAGGAAYYWWKQR
ncbi:HLA class II histocompatibility antigen, DR beta 5 chain-like [Anoplopoma fimbria]|uniref:HLA class II histocompatibility antigen, DR beta 5 chain-like n=1 Tax=Anoplopoma fimbria TaxID=229290 RepID=UPI0023EB2621|nr:HLA class II histocompatibility antigen, DR beta 5 chain-like [Anoplopoma fimbria]